ncbi:hypothetical protein JD844_001403 [Phrynosoma platyrhinos]|uniref:Izumo sperm-egg fusion protein 2 n=1 Tax=Phrynosoma platyrhinos TaxID=52577 RepID=A0ABQ7TAD9_PHRPL|nr:hypothetical protein JD844_001403 [Phrynosoma platyrhinos]
MLVPGLPLLLPLIFLPTTILCCLQCDAKFKENVSKLRTEVVPRQIHDTRLKERAEVLLKGLEGDFFLHYATSQFSGLAVKNKVDRLIQEVRSTTESLLQTTLAAFMNYQVFNCKGCNTIGPYCMTLSQCFVDAEERLSLRYGKPLKDPNLAQTGVAIVLCMGAVFFLVIIGVIVVYWRNRLFEFV